MREGEREIVRVREMTEANFWGQVCRALKVQTYASADLETFKLKDSKNVTQTGCQYNQNFELKSIFCDIERCFIDDIRSK